VACGLAGIIKKSVENHSKTANDKGVQIIVDDNLNHFVLSDEEVIQRVFDAVIDNAIKFTDKGYIKLSVTKIHEKDVLKVNIKDTGIGIDSSYLSLVFEPYRQESLGYTTKYQGAGLSLPLAKKALNLMGSDIEIESEKGIGTEVSIILKLTSGRQKPAEGKQTNKITGDNEHPPWYKKNVFLVEDDKINQILFTKLLKGCGNLIISGSGEEALDNLKIIKDKEFTIDFVLMDINLPGEWDGIKLMHHIKGNWEGFEKIPFIAQTAYAMANERGLLLEEGFDAYLSKPIKKSELANSISSVLSEQAGVQ
jgi:CheY-like chemotaxis protein